MPPSRPAALHEVPPPGDFALGAPARTLIDELDALADEETRLLAQAVGDHMPSEITHRVTTIRLRRVALHQTADRG